MRLLPKPITSLLVFFCLFSVAVKAAIQWPQLKYTELATVSNPVHITNAGDGSNRLFIVSQAGTISIHQGGQLLATPFLNISARVFAGNERGIFSIAFPPGYGTKRYFYVAYSRLSDGAVVLSRFTVPLATPNVANPASEQVLLAVSHPENNHNGGQLAFGPDGYLYFSLGDGGLQGDPSNNSQNPNILLGKLLRLDTESGVSPYAIPPTNPYVGVAGSRAEIWAIGLRNPWRFSFDRGNGDLYMADVGQDAWEEVNFQPAGSAGGKNYGWRILEGNHPYNVPSGFNISALTPPVIEYSHQSGTSITGGFVYRGPASRLDGLYVYADFTRGTVWGATREAGVWVTHELDVRSGDYKNISSFGEDQAGRLYAADYFSGKIYEITEDPIVRSPGFSVSSGGIPVISTGVHSNDIVVRAASATTNAILRYTTNGVDPTENDPLFPEFGLPVGETTTLKVKAFHAYLAASATVSASYSFAVATPTFSPPSGPIYPETGKNVALLSSTANAVIHYTLDGSTPTPESPVYSGELHFNVGPVTIQALAFRAGFAPSTVSSIIFGRPNLDNPSVNPNDGRIYNELSVNIFGSGEIRYTLDGTAPTEFSLLYTAPFRPAGPMPLRFRSFKFGYNSSAEIAVNLYFHNTESGSFGVGSGSGTVGYVNSSLYDQAQFRSPEAICFNGSGSYDVADTGNHAIRHTSPLGAVTTLAGNGTAGFVNAAGSGARFSSPRGICRDSVGNLYVADDGNHVIRRIDTTGNVTTYAGSGTAGTANGPGAQAQFLDLQGLAMDAAGNLYVGSLGTIRKVDTQRLVSTFATLPNAGRVTVAITPQGRIFATDSSAKLYEVSASGVVSVFAGGVSGFSDGDRTVARFQLNRSVSTDQLGILYLCDGDNIRKIRTNGKVITMVGPGSLSGPRGLAVGGDGATWIADTGNHRIYRISPSDWEADGIPDGNEGGLTPFVVGVDDRSADTDGDGQVNLTEYLGGSDPRNPASRFELKSVVPDGMGQVVIQWKSITGRYYQLYYSDDLMTWTTNGTYYPGTGNVVTATQTAAGGLRRFYKVLVQ